MTTTTARSLQLDGVYKEYPTPAEPLTVLRGVSLAMTAGQMLAIVGPSGSGKSTLLNIVGTLDRPTRGTVRIDGKDPFALSPADLAGFRSRHIGFVFQEHHLLPQCTAIENVLMARLAIGKVGRNDIAHAERLLDRVGLGHRATHLPGELSGGERQRVAIARALLNSPGLLLCDEPTGNLDSRTSRTIAELLIEVAREQNALLIAVTHSQMLADLIGRSMRMEDGRLI